MAFKQPFVGLYITPRQIEAVHCQLAKGGRLRIVSTHRLEIPADVLDSEGAILKEAVLATKLKELWQQAKLPTRLVVLALWGKKSIVRVIQMPRMKTLYQAILAEAEGYALYREDTDLILDYQEMGPPDVEYGPVIFTVTTRRISSSWTKCLKQAGLKVLAMDSAQMCAQRGLAFCHTADTPWMGATILPQKLIISYWNHNVTTIWREVMLATDWEGGDFHSMAERFEGELARTLASEAGLPDNYSILIAGDDMDNSLQLGLFLNERQSVPAEVAGLFKLLMEDDVPEEFHHTSLVTLGAALWSHLEPVPSFDMLRHEKTWLDTVGVVVRSVLQPVMDRMAVQGSRGAGALNTWLLQNGRYLGGGLAIGTVLGGGLLMTAWYENRALAQQARDIQTRIDVAQTRVDTDATPRPVNPLVAQQEQMKTLLEGKRNNRFPLRFLMRLQESIPSDTWVTTFSADEESTVTIEGASLQKGSIFQFLNAILALPEVHKLQTMQSSEGPGAHQFKFVLLYNPQPSPSIPPALVGTQNKL